MQYVTNYLKLCTGMLTYGTRLKYTQSIILPNILIVYLLSLKKTFLLYKCFSMFALALKSKVNDYF